MVFYLFLCLISSRLEHSLQAAWLVIGFPASSSAGLFAVRTGDGED